MIAEAKVFMQRIFLTAFFAGVAITLSACDEPPATLQFTGETMGTTYNVVAVDKTAQLAPAVVAAQIEETLRTVNAIMSNWDPASEISQFNKYNGTQARQVSDALFAVMTTAMEVHRDSAGQFDVTLGPLIELWGFGAPTSGLTQPSDAEIAAAMLKVGQAKLLTLTENPTTMAKAAPDTTVYLAAIAKGYGVDQVAATLRSLGLEDFMVEIGGDLYATGLNPDGVAWRIGIERPDPADRAVEQVIDVSGLGMATSGDYRNYFEEDGVRYSHIIDGVTGRPVRHKTASVTVLATSAMLADAWATALLALGLERGMAISEDLGLAVLFIVRDDASGALAFETVANQHFIEYAVAQ